MIYSMTGFGSSKFENDKYRIHVEIKSLNSKYFDLQLRIPKSLSEKEIEIRSMLSKKLLRGKVMAVIEVESKSVNPEVNLVNRELFKSYMNEFSELARESGVDPSVAFKAVMQQPDIMNPHALEDHSSEFFDLLSREVHNALDACMKFRSTEGENLGTELLGYIENIASLKDMVAEQEKVRAERTRERLHKGLNALLDSEELDKNRLEQEIIYYLEKLDITEELVRLGSHIKYFREVIKEDNAGKKLGFLSQELGREINTIGSKANDADIQRIVVQMKEELEKIKEQSLNVL